MCHMKESSIAAYRRCWPALLVFLLLGVTPLIVGELAGKQWRLILGALCLVAWLCLRPWRFVLATPADRQQIRIIGTICLAGTLLNYIITYFRL